MPFVKKYFLPLRKIKTIRNLNAQDWLSCTLRLCLISVSHFKKSCASDKKIYVQTRLLLLKHQSCNKIRNLDLQDYLSCTIISCLVYVSQFKKCCLLTITKFILRQDKKSCMLWYIEINLNIPYYFSCFIFLI